MVISLKKHIDASGGEAVKAAVDAFRSSIGSIAKAGALAIPPLGAGLLAKLNAVQERVPAQATPDQVADELNRNATMNVLRDARASVSRMLYVGARDTQPVTRTASRR